MEPLPAPAPRWRLERESNRAESLSKEPFREEGVIFEGANFGVNSG